MIIEVDDRALRVFEEGIARQLCTPGMFSAVAVELEHYRLFGGGDPIVQLRESLECGYRSATARDLVRVQNRFRFGGVL